MGKGGGGGSPAPAPAQQVVSKTEIPEWFKPYLTEVFERARTASEEAYQAPPDRARLQEIGKETIADIDPAQQEALDSLASADTAKVGLSAITEGQDLTRTGGTSITGDEITQAMNPFQQAVTDIAIREEQRRASTQRQQIQAQAARSGAFGGSRGALMEAEFERNLGQRLADIQTSGSAAAFDRATQRLMQERQRQLAAGQQMAGLGTTEQAATYSGLRTQLGAGEARRGLEQEQITRGLEEFQREADYPARQVGFYSGIIRGYQPPMNTYQSTMTPYSPTQALLGTATAAGALGKGFGLFNDGGIVSLAFGGAPSQQYTESVGDEEGISSMVGQPVASYFNGGGVQPVTAPPAMLSGLKLKQLYKLAEQAKSAPPNDPNRMAVVEAIEAQGGVVPPYLQRPAFKNQVGSGAPVVPKPRALPPGTRPKDTSPSASGSKTKGNWAEAYADQWKGSTEPYKGKPDSEVTDERIKNQRDDERRLNEYMTKVLELPQEEDLSWLDPENLYKNVDDFSYGPGKKASDLIKKSDAVEKETDEKESKEKTDLTDWFGLAAAGLALSGGRESDRGLAAKLLSGIKRPEERALKMMEAKYAGALPDIKRLEAARDYKAKVAKLSLDSRKLMREIMKDDRQFGLDVLKEVPEVYKMLLMNEQDSMEILGNEDATPEAKREAQARIMQNIGVLARMGSAGLAEGGAVPENLQKYGVTSIRNI